MVPLSLVHCGSDDLSTPTRPSEEAQAAQNLDLKLLRRRISTNGALFFATPRDALNFLEARLHPMFLFVSCYSRLAIIGSDLAGTWGPADSSFQVRETREGAIWTRQSG